VFSFVNMYEGLSRPKTMLVVTEVLADCEQGFRQDDMLRGVQNY